MGFIALLLIPFTSVSAQADQYRRWLDNGKTLTCTDMGSHIAVSLNNQDVEFANLPADAQFTINYIDNGVNTPDGPYTVEQTSGTKVYAAFEEDLPAYPLTFEFRLDTIVSGIVVYQSSISVSCSSDGTFPVTPYNFVPTVDRFRRWLDNGKTFTCTDMGSYIAVVLSNQDVEFANLPSDAQFTINYIDNGVNAPDGPFTVEQTSGTKVYAAFEEDFPAYPLTFEFRLDTIINGIVVYQSSLSVACSADATVAVTPTNINLTAGGGSGGALSNCLVPLPSTAVQGRLLESTVALYGPNPDETTNIILAAGGSWWVIGAQNGFYELWIACAANPLWVPASTLGPNYDSGWGGDPLPDAGA